MSYGKFNIKILFVALVSFLSSYGCLLIPRLIDSKQMVGTLSDWSNSVLLPAVSLKFIAHFLNKMIILCFLSKQKDQ